MTTETFRDECPLGPPALPETWGVRYVWLVAFTGGWATLVAASFWGLLSYSQAAGSRGATPQVWPANSKLPIVDGKQTLIMFLHPRCPCSWASLDELEVLAANAVIPQEALVAFVRPPDVTALWERDRLWDRAVQLSGVRVVADPGGLEARLFGVETSGHTLVFDSSGRLQFSGGITAFRGHLGDNEGLRSVQQLTQGRLSLRSTHCVYGCPLLTPKSATTEVLERTDAQ